jgi:hypothetical protein
MAKQTPTVELRPAAEQHTLRVAVLAYRADTEVSVQLASMLCDAGIEVTEDAPDVALDGLLVLLSTQALADPAWRDQAEERAATRIVPVRIGDIAAAELPDRLKELNWIDWRAENPSATFGSVLAGLLADPARRRVSRELAHEAETWQRAGQPKELLIDDHRRAQQMADLLADLQGDPMASPSALTLEFVERSAAVSRRSHRRHRRRLALILAGAGLAVIALAIYIPKIDAATLVNHAAIVTAGEQSVLDALPEWSAANAADLLLEGTGPQKVLGRDTLLQAMQRPWGITNVNFIANVRAISPLAGGTRAVVLAATTRGSALALIDSDSARILWSLALRGSYQQLHLANDGTVAILAGAGVASVNLTTHSVRAFGSSALPAQAWPATGGRIAISTASGALQQLAVLEAAHGKSTTIGAYHAVLDIAPNARGSTSALVEREPNNLQIIDLAHGAVLASAQISTGLALGALAPDGAHAIVAGADGQLWRFGAREPATPTGIAVPGGLQRLAWASDERLVLVSESERGQVIYLPRAEPLGHVCWDVAVPTELSVEAGGATVACVGNGLSAVWSLPAAPSPLSAPGRSSHITAENGVARVEVNGSQARLDWRGTLGTGSTPWFSPADATITAVAFAPSGGELVIGSAGGQATVVGLGFEHARITVEWQDPDHSRVTTVGWGATAVASTATGQTWHLPGCASCASDSGLLRAVRTRFTGCFTERQIQWIDDRARAQIGLRICPPVAPLPES